MEVIDLKYARAVFLSRPPINVVLPQWCVQRTLHCNLTIKVELTSNFVTTQHVSTQVAHYFVKYQAKAHSSFMYKLTLLSQRLD